MTPSLFFPLQKRLCLRGGPVVNILWKLGQRLPQRLPLENKRCKSGGPRNAPEDREHKNDRTLQRVQR